MLCQCTRRAVTQQHTARYVDCESGLCFRNRAVYPVLMKPRVIASWTAIAPQQPNSSRSPSFALPFLIVIPACLGGLLLSQHNDQQQATYQQETEQQRLRQEGTPVGRARQLHASGANVGSVSPLHFPGRNRFPIPGAEDDATWRLRGEAA